ncbi:helix-turn-helix transcriptional regulator [Thiomicrorhabdus cannonii]|uniref:helix-turn-helix transcriptional regulator n=1 Tax=Thiomicrorhabdus cannonii TaxID=2748011 RepID=UPI0015C03187|nr:WYL domain-containing protein [Thiomicrorhabdus cannonii]
MNDACFRRIQTLRFLPTAPARISVSHLHDKLTGQGFDIDKRSLQRDLNSLSKLFAIENDGNKDIPGWYWRKDAEKLELPEMEPAVALSFRMVKLFLEKFMPPSTLGDLDGYFRHSDNVLNNLTHNHLSGWNDKVALLSRSQPLLSPAIDPVVLAETYQALLLEKQIKAHYQPRNEEPRDYIINPHGIVIVDKIIYLVGSLWEYQDIKQFALHRFISAEQLESDMLKQDSFNLNNYIHAGHFEYLVDQNQFIELKLKINKIIATHLSESKLSKDQTITRTETEIFLEATVKNTQQLRWWLMGFGKSIEIVEPENLRKEFKNTFKELYETYSADSV